MVRGRARWYEHRERKSKYFYNLDKKNQKKQKHITPLVNNDGDKITNSKDILGEKERFFEEIHTSRNMDPKCPNFNEFFETENALSEEIAKTCEGVMSIHGCELALKAMENKKLPARMG